jgi:hypothetical protein
MSHHYVLDIVQACAMCPCSSSSITIPTPKWMGNGRCTVKVPVELLWPQLEDGFTTGTHPDPL